MKKIKPILTCQFETSQLIKNNPPDISDRNKFIAFEIGLNNKTEANPIISYTRWPQVQLPKTIPLSNTKLIQHNSFFNYPDSTNERLEWHLNFAHQDLFGYYGGHLFAQDEMQVTEHPVLGCLREKIVSDGIVCLTVEHGRSTPILLTNVERRSVIATEKSADRPHGLYGNLFHRASEDTIKQATSPITPPTISNIIAMESPQPQTGLYTEGQIKFILASAITGFSAAVKITKDMNPMAVTSIHTGYWGCGAYGGNRELMPLLQIISAYCAEVDILHFHTGGDTQGYMSALQKTEYLIPDYDEISMTSLIGKILDLNYDWGVSDGN